MTDEFPNDANGDVLRRMKAEGDNLAKARDMDFQVVFADQTKAESFAAVFRQQNLRAEVKRSNVAKGLPWDVRVVKHMLPTHAGITAFEDELQAVADRFGGRNDGWGSFNQG